MKKIICLVFAGLCGCIGPPDRLYVEGSKGGWDGRSGSEGDYEAATVGLAFPIRYDEEESATVQAQREHIQALAKTINDLTANLEEEEADGEREFVKDSSIGAASAAAVALAALGLLRRKMFGGDGDD